MVELLNKLRIGNTLPAFNDLESATAIELVSKVYGKMNELIKDYNSFVDNVNKIVSDFKESTNKDLEEFEVALRQEFQDFIDVINLKVMEQDKDIEDAVNYMKDNIVSATRTIVNEELKNHNIEVTTDYNQESKELRFVFDNGGDN